MDGASLGRLWREFCIEGGSKHPDVSRWLQDLAGAHNAGILIGVAAWDGAAMVGFTEGVVTYDPTTAETWGVGRTLYVAPEHRGKGYSETLMKALIEQALARGATQVVVHGTRVAKMLDRISDGPGVWEQFYRVPAEKVRL